MNTLTPFAPPVPAAVDVPKIRTRQQLDVLLENIADLQRERDDLMRAQENEIAAVRQRYRAPLAEIEDYLQLETGWAEAWARENSAALGSDRTLTSPHATLGFRGEPPRIERASRRWNWTRIALTLAGLPWGKRYLRIPSPEVDKDALLADLPRLSPVELRSAGIRVVEGEQFFLTTHGGSEITAAREYQEAA
jgi:phage host-nuclease inhibitor protein Gam